MFLTFKSFGIWDDATNFNLCLSTNISLLRETYHVAGAMAMAIGAA